jgi:hypothetical protein
MQANFIKKKKMERRQNINERIYNWLEEESTSSSYRARISQINAERLLRINSEPMAS